MFNKKLIIQTIDLLIDWLPVVFWEVLTVILWIIGTLISGCVFRQKVRIEVQMKNTETIPTL